MRFRFILILICSLFSFANTIYGPVNGTLFMEEAIIWLQTEQKADIYIKYTKLNTKNWIKTTTQTTNFAKHFVTRFHLSKLNKGSSYIYKIFVDGKEYKQDHPFTFKTLAHWQWRQPTAGEFSIALGSCTYINDPEDDRPNKYGGGFEIFDAIAEKSPLAMLWIGDNVYFREPDWDSKIGMIERYKQSRNFKPMQRLLSSTSHYALWDDHDYGSNNSNSSFALKQEALDVFKMYWSNPSYGQPNSPGIYTQFQIGDAAFFFLDNRFYRDDQYYPNTKDKQMFGAKQMRWLKNALLASRAQFKFIVSGGQILNDRTKYEAMHFYQREHKELLDFLKDPKLSGVIIISGDRHHTDLEKLERRGTYPLYDYTSSPLTSGTHVPDDFEKSIPYRMDPDHLVTERNFGLLTFGGKTYNERYVIISTFDVKGQLIWEYRINGSELRNKRGS